MKAKKLKGKNPVGNWSDIQDDEHTLTDHEIDDVMQKMISGYEVELKAEIRRVRLRFLFTI